MCGLCGALGVGDHWSKQPEGIGPAMPAAVRHRQADAANAILRLYGLKLKVWNDRYMLYGHTGKSAVVDHIGQVWPLAETFASAVIDPLDPALLARIEALS